MTSGLKIGLLPEILICRHTGIYLSCPGQNTSFEVVEIVIALRLQVLYYAAAAGTTAAVYHHRLIFSYLVYMVGDGIHRYEYPPYLADLRLLRLTYIYELKIVTPVHHGLELGYRFFFHDLIFI